MTTPSSRELTPNLRDMVLPPVMDTSSHDLIKDFFIPLLQNSCYYDRGVGYFSSGWLRISAIGLSSFAENGGRARWVTSPILSKPDWEALKLGSKAQQDRVLFEVLRNNINDLARSLEESTLNALAWMVADGILEFRLAIPKIKLDGEFHDKFGIFQDVDGNKVSFNGSYNDSIQGTRNYESIKVFKSWSKTGSSLVEQDQARFDRLWLNEDPNIKIYELDEDSVEDIIQLRKMERPYKQAPLVPKDRISYSEAVLEAQVPSIPDRMVPREYQEKAVRKWIKNGFCGLFEMATGTGKTITALLALIELIEQRGNLITIVVAPTLSLVNQWVVEVKNFHFWDITVAMSTNPKWEIIFQRTLTSFKLGNAQYPVIITTYSTFKIQRFQSQLARFPTETVVIFDECHWLGASEMQSNLPWSIKNRLGLSATPHRNFD